VWAFLIGVPAELIAQQLQSLDRVSGTAAGAELFDRAITPLKLPEGLPVNRAGHIRLSIKSRAVQLLKASFL
jgi:hypothetical protein